MIIESGVCAATVRLSLVVEQWLSFKPPRLGSCRHYASHYRLADPSVRQDLVCGLRRGQVGEAKGAFGQGCGENSRAQVVVVVNLDGCLAPMSVGCDGGWPFCPFCELVPGGCGQFRANLDGEVGEPVMSGQPAQARFRQRAGGVGVPT